MNLEELTMVEFEAGLKKTKTIIIPVGSIEEHGPHLPLGTDAIHVFEAAKEAAERVDVFVCPPLFFGLCRSTRDHPGTVSISGDTLRSLLKDIVRSLYRHGLRNFVVVSGHASPLHLAALNEAGEALLDELPEARIAVTPDFELASDEIKEVLECAYDSHAGEMETSRILYLRPDLVKGKGEREQPQFPRPLLVRRKRSFWRGGVWGEPERATPEKGKKIQSLIVAGLEGLVRKIEAFKE